LPGQASLIAFSIAGLIRARRVCLSHLRGRYAGPRTRQPRGSRPTPVSCRQSWVTTACSSSARRDGPILGAPSKETPRAASRAQPWPALWAPGRRRQPLAMAWARAIPGS